MNKTLPILTPDFSYISTHESCPRKHFYRHRLNLAREEVNPYLLAGNAVHDGLEVWYKGGTESEAQAALSETWGGHKVPETHNASHLNEGLLRHVLSNYISDHRNSPWEIVVAFDEAFGERVFEFDWDGLTVGGKIDLVVEDAGSYYLVDFKTTSQYVNSYWMAQRKLDLSHQGRLYWAAVESELDVTLSGMYYMVLYVGEKATDPPEKWESRKSSPWRRFGPYHYSPAQLEETRSWIQQGLSDIEHHAESESEYEREAEAWPQAFGFQCSYCDFLSLCESSPVVRDRKIEREYVRRELDGKLASGADSSE